MGPEIVGKAIGLLMRNLGAALRASAAPLVIFAALAWFLGRPALATLATVQADLGADPVAVDPAVAQALAAASGRLILVALLYGVAFCWIAVAWHRYVLLEEDPGLVPVPPAGALLRYALTAIAVALVVVALAIPVSLVAGALIGSLGPDAGFLVLSLLGFGIGVLLSYVGLRFSLALPAKAVGGDLGIGGSWTVTKRASGAILTVAILLSALNAVFQIVAGALGTLGIAGVLLGLAVTWFSTMLGVSILTALYGHLVEGRPV
ncbi:hypothetical protein BCF33_1920 [Hasllibacter halocynthiae]|uniref:Glycerophosphoryl diester phosphodiesterase family protein n=1 Tax=Hasllibacter halocynthiae TaxID=595589 RepID=A0A2T0X2H3_9RHOB|nr:hypothetical protein [Hasllibacter halocynthiae]PRY93054.1 hypothetical protein BCF33_1920 [Hasllibacter halocynthiae]